MAAARVRLRRGFSVLGWAALAVVSAYLTVINVAAWATYTNNQALGGPGYWGESALDAGMGLLSVATIGVSFLIAKKRRLTGIHLVGSAMGWAILIEFPLLVFAAVVGGPF